MAVAALMVAAPASASIVVNGGFEAGDFSGWTQFGNAGFTSVGGVFGGIMPAEGDFHAWFGPIDTPGGITQTLTTVAGTEYSVGFSLARTGFANNNFFSASFGDTLLVELTNWPASIYQDFGFTVTAGGGSTPLTFTFRNNPNFFLLDAVSVTAVNGGGAVIPEPATWAMMIAGFGLVGATARRRRRTSAISA
jgi:hypothetical protein